MKDREPTSAFDYLVLINATSTNNSKPIRGDKYGINSNKRTGRKNVGRC